MEFTYLTQPVNRYTFKQPQLRKWVEDHCEGKVLNLFAGKVKLSGEDKKCNDYCFANKFCNYYCEGDIPF